MEQTTSRELSFWLPIYVLVALLLLNCGLYAAYYSTASMWKGEHPDYVFLFRLIDPSFPLYGLIFAFSTSSLGYLLVFVTLRKTKDVILRSVCGVLSAIAPLLLSLTFMPFSLTLGFSYTGLAAVVFVVILTRGTILRSTTNINPNEMLRREDKESLRETLKLRHSTLLTLFRDSIWASITFAVAAFSALLLYQLNSLFNGASAVYVIFWRWQTLLLLVLLLYYLFGWGLTITLPILRATQKIEKLLKEI